MGARLTNTDSELLTVEQMAELHPTLFTCNTAAARRANLFSLDAALADAPLPVIDAAALKKGTLPHEGWAH